MGTVSMWRLWPFIWRLGFIFLWVELNRHWQRTFLSSQLALFGGYLGVTHGRLGQRHKVVAQGGDGSWKF